MTNLTSLESETFIIQGLTQDGKTFRPSDWAERLCGVMASVCPGEQSGGSRSNIRSFCPYVTCCIHNGVVSVLVDPALKEVSILAFHFIVGFAKDNQLQVKSALEINSELIKSKSSETKAALNEIKNEPLKPIKSGSNPLEEMESKSLQKVTIDVSVQKFTNHSADSVKSRQEPGEVSEPIFAPAPSSRMRM